MDYHRVKNDAYSFSRITFFCRTNSLLLESYEIIREVAMQLIHFITKDLLEMQLCSSRWGFISLRNYVRFNHPVMLSSLSL